MVVRATHLIPGCRRSLCLLWDHSLAVASFCDAIAIISVLFSSACLSAALYGEKCLLGAGSCWYIDTITLIRVHILYKASFFHWYHYLRYRFADAIRILLVLNSVKSQGAGCGNTQLNLKQKNRMECWPILTFYGSIYNRLPATVRVKLIHLLKQPFSAGECFL